MALPASFLAHLQQRGYHSRSDKHSKALGEAVVEALMAECPALADAARAGRVVFQHNHNVTYAHSTWNTDLAIGPPPPGLDLGPRPAVAGMKQATPATVRIAVEAKAVMTEHRKAIKNRKRDLEAHHQHVHDYDPSAIAAGIVALNASTTFQSPLRAGLSSHGNVGAVITHCLNEVSSITMAHGTSAVGLDAKCALVLVMDNVEHAATCWLERPPAPPVGSPVHWDAFIQRLCQLYTTRFR
jgi:hypothetical protein